jgi:hypothetical protein
MNAARNACSIIQNDDGVEDATPEAGMRGLVWGE